MLALSALKQKISIWEDVLSPSLNEAMLPVKGEVRGDYVRIFRRILKIPSGCCGLKMRREQKEFIRKSGHSLHDFFQESSIGKRRQIFKRLGFCYKGVARVIRNKR